MPAAITHQGIPRRYSKLTEFKAYDILLIMTVNLIERKQRIPPIKSIIWAGKID